jgi:ATP-dependent Clp protease protease subunit
MGVPVHALCLGQVGTAAAGVVAVCTHRAAMPSTRFVLREPSTQVDVHVRDVAQWVALRTDERQRFSARLSAATGTAAAEVEADLSRGRLMGASEAVAYGLLDEICGPEAEIHRLPGSPIGFRPLR